MTENAEALTARPADMVPVAVGAFEEVWRSRGHFPALLNVITTKASVEAETRLSDVPERDSTEALTVAWGVVWRSLERLMLEHGYLPDTIRRLIAESAKQVRHVAESDGDS
ncbi:hypothetical protein GCM10022254_24600 [Actinomadura meridiana]|uniref:Uncharacterized protein n=1 Tax=Actinomadura meridiana TaxID=559626 RepID=A0ABP8BYB9_9ACTN